MAIKDSGGCADHCFVRYLIREPEAWRDVVLVKAVQRPVGDGVSAGAGEQQCSERRIAGFKNEIAGVVVYFEEWRYQFPTRAEVDGELGAYFPVVLRIELIGPLLQHTGHAICKRPIRGQSEQEVPQRVPCARPRLRIVCMRR